MALFGLGVVVAPVPGPTLGALLVRLFKPCLRVAIGLTLAFQDALWRTGLGRS